MAYTLPSATGVFVPDFAASGNLITNFSRSPSSFPLTRWAAYQSVTKPIGYYLKLNVDQCARVLDVTGKGNIWPRGNDAPQLTWGTESFQFSLYQTQRYMNGYVLDRGEAQNAEWDIQSSYNAIHAQQAMTLRECMTIDVATTTGNYDSTHVATANNVGGGYLNAGTAANPIFKNALQTAFRRIHLDTRGAVRPQDLQVVMNPATANAISLSAEITDFVKNNQFGLAQLRGGEPNQNANWGLPDKYSDFNIVVDDTVLNPNEPQVGSNAQAGQYAWPWGTVAMFARPGGLMAPQGGPSFSTIHCFLVEDMTVETIDDVNNRKFTSRVVNDWVPIVVAPVSGFLITSALATQPTNSIFGPVETPPTFGAGPTTFSTGINPDLQAKLDLQSGQIERLLARLEAQSAEIESLKGKLGEGNPDRTESAPTQTNPQNRPSGHKGK